MTPCAPIRLGLVLGLALAAGAARADYLNAAGRFAMWRVERSAPLRESGDLDSDSLQLIAQQLGRGRFRVRAVPIAGGAAPTDGARVLVTARDPDPGEGAAEGEKRIFFGGEKAKFWIRSGTDAQIVGGFFQSRARAEWDNAASVSLIADVVSAAVYSGTATAWDGRFRQWTDSKLAATVICSKGQIAELRDSCTEPIFTREAGGNSAWRGRFILADGSAEGLAVLLPAQREGLVKVERNQIRPPGYFFRVPTGAPAAEEWSVMRVVTWLPPRRYSSMLAMATLGQTQMKFRLASVLLEANNSSSVAEGIGWLNSAAADGSREAVDRLSGLGSCPIRPSRERDSVRMEWCDCFNRKPVPAK